ncbi:hypothetical protein GCM10027176_88220 [Actinoallomurus bryophytorum]|uniref:Uncharacterized protein n=1 Tax=Actinoallomurus bryophytorum TaxID=1490222 RepID=A0A543CMB1_9ACTN|nr:hypothetical protein [Actinoallomurus bryophytorum]TQL98246.1 hypothetical protein FB559_3869 [Actinoallomurus bryophytorum]
MTSRRDPKAVGIAPAALSEFIADLQSKVESGYPQISSLKNSFSRYGISTSHIAQIESVLKWANDQIPMLRRRQSLAEQAGVEKFDLQSSVPMVSAGAGVLDGFKDSGEAKRAGKADADDALSTLKSEHDIGDVLRRLKINSLDPDYAEAFYRRLGPSGIRALSLAIGQMGDNSSVDPKSAREAVGRSLATASHRIHIDDKWLNQLSSSPAIAASDGPAALAPFLEYGNFDKDWLKLLGVHVVAGNIKPGPSQKIWQALAKNPRASTEFYHDHFLAVQHYVSIHGPGLSGGVANAFAGVVRAATIDGRKVDRWLAEFNAGQTIYYWKNHPGDHTTSPIRLAYADMAKEYWDDLVYSVSSPVKEAGAIDNPFRKGIEVSEDAWKPFLNETMHDPQAAADILIKHRKWLEDARRKAVSETPIGATPENWEGQSIAAMRDFLHGTYSDVSSDIAKQGSDARDKFNGDVKGSVKDATKWLADKGIEKLNPGADIDWATSTASLVASKGLDFLFGDDKPGKVDQLQDRPQFGGRDSWQGNAADVWEQRLANAHQGGLPWQGDPRKFEKNFGAKFTDESGHVMPLDKITQDPKALLAYNEWLKDPAVIRATERFVNRERGLPGGN